MKEVTVNDKTCSKCIYHSTIGAGDRLIVCMYAIRVGKCRTLEPGYKEGVCRRFIKGKPNPTDTFKTTYTKVNTEMGSEE